MKVRVSVIHSDSDVRLSWFVSVSSSVENKNLSDFKILGKLN